MSSSSDFQQRLLTPEATDQWLWIVILGSFGAFVAAFGIGANDVGNAFATSVGSKALTLKQALVLAGVFEFLGALLLGRHIVSSVTGKIFNIECFILNPGVLMYGLMCVMYTTGAWLLIASYLGLPVSTTHSTIGGLLGMAVAFDRGDILGQIPQLQPFDVPCVIWYRETDSFPYMEGVGAVVLSWFVSPVLAALVAMGVFAAVRGTVLRSQDAFDRSFWAFPILVMVTIGVNVFFFVYEGPTNEFDLPSLPSALLWSTVAGVTAALVLIPTAIPVMKANVLRLFNEDGTRKVYPIKDAEDIELMGATSDNGSGTASVVTFVSSYLDRDVHATVETSPKIKEIHAQAEKFDPRVEEVFKYVQVVTAICDAFAHGANDVANATGPLEVLYLVFVHGGLQGLQMELGGSEYLILTVGGVGMVLGLAVYGHKVITAIGVELAKITPSRGFSIELGAALLIIIGSKLHIPLSSTHCQVGATVGVAVLEGRGGLNYSSMVKIMLGWAFTLVVCGLVCSLLFVQGVYAPYAYDTIDPATLVPQSSTMSAGP